MKSLKLPFLFVSVLCLACSDDEDASTSNAPDLRPLSGEATALVESNNQFALDIFREVHRETPAENVFVSPLSVDIALHMTANGAKGTTHTEIKQTLGVADLSDEEVNRAVRDLTAQLVSMDRKIILAMANSIWLRDIFTLKDGFADLIQTYYKGRIEALDFDRPETRDRINGWVEDQTQGKIKNLLEEIEDTDVMFLINAIYFKADWQYRFDPAQTQEAPFYLEDGSEVVVPMMFSEGVKLRQYYDEQRQLIDIPYGNGQFSFVVLLPNPTAGSVAEAAGQLNADDLNRWLAEADTLTPQLYLPKFKTSYKMNLSDPLINLGMKRPFDQNADFSRFFNEVDSGLYIDRVIHQAFIEVNETGSEAAAATAVAVSALSSVSEPQPLSVRIDRPFVYFIRERHTQAILFAGTMMSPSQSP